MPPLADPGLTLEADSFIFCGSERGTSSVVERDLAKVDVASSTLVSRSNVNPATG
jgi:hypothetical protein